MPDSIIRLPSLLLLLSSSVYKTLCYSSIYKTISLLQSSKWLLLAIISQLQLQSHHLEHSSTLFLILVTIWLICQMFYDNQGKFTKEAAYLQDLYLAPFNLAGQLCLFLDQVLSLWTMILTRRILLLILLLI